jgi:hypothetical protein
MKKVAWEDLSWEGIFSSMLLFQFIWHDNKGGLFVCFLEVNNYNGGSIAKKTNLITVCDRRF